MSHHTLLHRAVGPLVTGLARIGIAPDLVTALRFVTGIGASACLLAGRGPLMVAGALLWAVSMLLDRTDGALARFTGRSSRYGARIDLISDCLCTMTLFLGLGIGVGARPGGMSMLGGALMGGVAAIAVAVTFAALSRIEPEEEQRRPVDPDDVMLVVPVLILCGQTSVLLLLAAILAPVGAVAAVFLLAQRSRAEARLRRSIIAVSSRFRS
ncbi:CDP-alcohol phosphatidyltransferase family protein [Acetobacteraceae bacterium KSS8]|uniref:CDP-alcohol phosphatidyltransferase family protein n=1 Tax=Endosaccharibacter trunci TaxID=2812733 RepID=A0ABT1W3X5_9PROT|nr:CDP-alcohol phosphatidyltransferase family protein [Acetobacteraceae bacterium KSS8]